MKNSPIILLMILALAACNKSGDATTEEEAMKAVLQLSSPEFSQGAAIPSRFSCDGDDQSPRLEWSEPPAGTRSFALIMDDPDAPVGTWVHWVLYNIPAETRALPEGIKDEKSLTDGSLQGMNSWKDIGYGGPCPPSGQHHYFFKIYALDVILDSVSGWTKADLLQRIEGHVLAEGQLTGVYTR